MAAGAANRGCISIAELLHGTFISTSVPLSPPKTSDYPFKELQKEGLQLINKPSHILTFSYWGLSISNVINN